MKQTPKLVVILPTMTVAEIAELCKQHDAYVRIEHTGGKPYAFMEPYPNDEHIPSFLRRQAE
jgi:hypothetical protein